MEREEAIKIVKSHYPANKQMLNEALEFLIPELKESDDERIRKALVRFHKSTIDVDGIKGEEIVAWLEKQGEKKPSWSEEDEALLQWTNCNLTEIKERFGEKYGEVGECISWLKSLKERLS